MLIDSTIDKFHFYGTPRIHTPEGPDASLLNFFGFILSGMKRFFDYSIKQNQLIVMKKFIQTCIAAISTAGVAQEIEIPKTEQGFDIGEAFYQALS